MEGLDMGDKKQRAQARRHVGLVFQYPEYQLFEETVARDVAYGPRNMGLGEEEIQRRVDTALGLVGLPPRQFGEKSPFSLSGGERRRAALAGVIAMEPKYLILDEPMACLLYTSLPGRCARLPGTSALLFCSSAFSIHRGSDSKACCFPFEM